MSQRLPRLLNAREIRVLGCLMEKEQATPEYYPLTVNALLAACNQRSNRDPVLTLSEREVRITLEQLVQEKLVSREEGTRAPRFRHELDRLLGLNAARKAALTVLMLRGPQTAGEVRGRTGRLHEYASTAAAEDALADLAGPPDPLAELLEREPGQKEPRWAHRLAAPESTSPRPAPAAEPAPERTAPKREFDPERIMLRLDRLEQQVQELQSALQRLRGATD